MTWEEPAKGTYTGRHIQEMIVESLDNGIVKTLDNSGFSLPADQIKLLKVAGYYALELQRGSTIAGIGTFRNGDVDWLFRHDDHTLWSQWKKQVDESRAEHVKFVDENYADWVERLDKLPSPLREELTKGIQDPEFVYGFMGLGYCLVIAELAVLYKASDGEDSVEVDMYASKHGTSGNQHHMAQAIAKQRL